MVNQRVEITKSYLENNIDKQLRVCRSHERYIKCGSPFVFFAKAINQRLDNFIGEGGLEV